LLSFFVQNFLFGAPFLWVFVSDEVLTNAFAGFLRFASPTPTKCQKGVLDQHPDRRKRSTMTAVFRPEFSCAILSVIVSPARALPLLQ
jgi:hypothetical protein